MARRIVTVAVRRPLGATAGHARIASPAYGAALRSSLVMRALRATAERAQTGCHPEKTAFSGMLLIGISSFQSENAPAVFRPCKRAGRRVSSGTALRSRRRPGQPKPATRPLCPASEKFPPDARPCPQAAHDFHGRRVLGRAESRERQMLILRARRAPVDQSRLFGQLRGRKTALSIAQEMTHVQTDAQPMLLQKVKSQSSEIAAVDVFQQEGRAGSRPASGPRNL